MSRYSQEWRNFCSSAPLKAAHSLRQILGIDEVNYLGVVGHAHGDSRAYFLYGCVDEVYKVCTAMIRWIEFMGEPKEEAKRQLAERGDDGKHMARIVREAVYSEQQMWSRKLSEILTDLILFNETNEQEYYRLYLACTFLDAYLRLQEDFQQFFACRNGNADHTIKDEISLILKLQVTLDPSKLWFQNALISETKIPGAGRLLSSFRRRFLLALEKAASDQRVALGISYEPGYSVPSRLIHGSVGGPLPDLREDSLDVEMGRISLLAAHIVLCGYKLLGREPDGMAAALRDALLGEDAERQYLSIICPSFEVGDLVRCDGKDLCLIVDKAVSRYGYMSFKVRYLTRPLLRELPEDWFPARYIRMVWLRKDLRRQLKELFTRQGVTTEALQKLDAVADDRISDLLSETIKEWEEAGILWKMLGVR